MAEEWPESEHPPTPDVADRAKSTEPINVGSSAARVLHGVRRSKEHDLRMIEQFSRASIPELSSHLSDFKSRKYELLRQYSDLERLRDSHPQRGRLDRLERRIWLIEEAIRSKEHKPAAEKRGEDQSVSPSPTNGQTEAPSEQLVKVGAVMPPLSVRAPAHPISQPQPSRRRAGRKPNAGYNAQVAEVLRDFPDWRDRLREVCEALDKRDVVLPQTKKAKRQGWATWMDAFDEDPEWVRKALQHRAAAPLWEPLR